MATEEKERVLEMVAQGKITPEEAMGLIKALEAGADEPDAGEAGGGSGLGAGSGGEFEAVRARARRFSALPLWSGTGLTVLAAYWLFTLVRDAQYGLWFACAWFPLALGILLLALASGGFGARWVYVDVEQGTGEWPERLTFGLPLPLGLVGWLLRAFRGHLRGRWDLETGAILEALAAATWETPLVVDVEDDEDGDRVRVYIG